MPERHDRKLMRRCLRLARRGAGMVSPNPRVGAVVAAPDGTVLGEGYHEKYGHAHAEVNALKAAKGSDLPGATLYVNLEPCCYEGKTPPCSDIILSSGVKRVVTATLDPNPKVNGRGLQILSDSGVEVEVGVLSGEAKYLNRGYFSRRLRNRAWCALKVAVSLDGKMANPEKVSKWITCSQARSFAHALRADHDSILIGGGTVEHDNPELTVRHVKGRNPVRIILSSRYGIPQSSRIAQTASRVPTILITGEGCMPQGVELEHIQVMRFKTDDDGRIDPERILKTLPEHGLLSVLIEGGSDVLSSFMQSGLVDEIWIVIAPSVIGHGLSPFEGFLPESWESRPRYSLGVVKRMDSDLIVSFTREGDLFSQD